LCPRRASIGRKKGRELKAALNVAREGSDNNITERLARRSRVERKRKKSGGVRNGTY